MRVNASQIRHPRTGQPVSLDDLSRETGLNVSTLKSRWDANKRGLDLIAPVIDGYVRTPAEIRADRRRLFSEQLTHWLQTPTGRLSTHRFRDFAGGAA